MPADSAELVVAFLKDRSHPCPSCGYELRDLPSAVCPECAEPLELIIRPRTPRFGWLIVAMAPGCFSGVMAVLMLLPIALNLRFRSGPMAPDLLLVMGADAFGFLSAASVGVMYRHRRRILSWRARRQATFAAYIWGAHIVAFVLFVVGLLLWG